MEEILAISQNIIMIWWSILICLWIVVMILVISILLKLNSIITDIKQKYFLAMVVFSKPIIILEKLIKAFKK